MIDFMRFSAPQKEKYQQMLFSGSERSCEYSFANKCLWGRQEIAYLEDCAAFLSHFHGKDLYSYPIGSGDRRAALQAVREDARERGIPCRIVCMTPREAEELEGWFPGQFRLHSDRDSFDYVYDIHDLADLKGRKFQKKRNHLNRFRAEHPEAEAIALCEENLDAAREMAAQWYASRLAQDPEGDYRMEQEALGRAFDTFSEVGLEGMMLVENGQVLAMTMGSRLSPETMDIHFEKAREDVDGAYAAINCEFARYLRDKHPELRYLNREEDMGLEGLRKAKLSYQPHHFAEKYWAEEANGELEGALE